MKTFSASLTNLMALLPQSHDRSCYVSRPILAPPPLWLQKHTDLRAHDLAHYPISWRQPRPANVTCSWSWRLCGIIPAIVPRTFRDLFHEHQGKVAALETVPLYNDSTVPHCTPSCVRGCDRRVLGIMRRQTLGFTSHVEGGSPHNPRKIESWLVLLLNRINVAMC